MATIPILETLLKIQEIDLAFRDYKFWKDFIQKRNKSKSSPSAEETAEASKVETEQ